jgi:hypothetical protein
MRYAFSLMGRRGVILLSSHLIILLVLRIVLPHIGLVVGCSTICLLLEVREEVCPHHVCLINVGTLGLTHLNEVIYE